jgi:ribonucleoside-diphosphate reductase beta chain
MSAQPPRHARILDPGFELTLRPMRYPAFYEMYRNAIKNTWTVEEVDFSMDTSDLRTKMSPADRHLIQRLVAFFATGDTNAAFAAIETIPSIRQKGAFCFKWIDSIQHLQRLETREHRRQFLLNMICFAACIEGLFFYAAFAYVYYLRSRGLLHGLAAGTNWVFRDESGHMAFAFDVVRTVRDEEPELFDDAMRAQVEEMMEDAIACETQFADDVLSGGVVGLSAKDMRQYLEYCADQRFAQLDMPKKYGAKNPFDFMDLQDVQEVTNFFERRVSAYQVGVQGEVAFDMAF